MGVLANPNEITTKLTYSQWCSKIMPNSIANWLSPAKLKQTTQYARYKNLINIGALKK